MNKNRIYRIFLGCILIAISEVIANVEKNVIYIIPEDEKYLDDVFFEYYPSWKIIKKEIFNKGYILKTPARCEKDEAVSYLYNFEKSETIKYIIDLTPNNLFTLLHVQEFYRKIIIFLWEPPTVTATLYDPALHKKLAKVFTWNDALVDGKKYFKIYYPVFFKWTFDPTALRSYHDKKLCTLINCNKTSNHPLELYSERKSIIEFFETIRDDDFDFYGIGWPHGIYKNYKGIIECQRDYLPLYRFAICYENMKDTPGYVTEKIFNCLTSGCIPIYWGASNIQDYIPQNCFIDRRQFNSHEELYNYIKNMPSEQYYEYLENILAFLTSDEPLKFTPEHLCMCVQEGLLA